MLFSNRPLLYSLYNFHSARSCGGETERERAEAVRVGFDPLPDSTGGALSMMCQEGQKQMRKKKKGRKQGIRQNHTPERRTVQNPA